MCPSYVMVDTSTVSCYGTRLSRCLLTYLRLMKGLRARFKYVEYIQLIRSMLISELRGSMYFVLRDVLLARGGDLTPPSGP